MSASSSNKRIWSVDRLSALPDDILCYILSFLEMKEASITCLLSKRWRFLWTKLPVLRFTENVGWDGENRIKFVIRVNKTLVICSRRNLERFEVNMFGSYGSHIPLDVNVWIRFAIENKVKEFSLVLPFNHLLPQMIYSNPSWTSLRLGGCIVAPQETIQWQSLTSLRIEDAELNEDTFEKILSGCPVLSSLEILQCWGFNCLEFNSPILDRLTIQEFDYRGDLKISAPYIRTLKIVVKCRSLFLENIKSLVRAEVNVHEVGWDATNFWNKRLRQHFGSLRCVKMLKLGGEFNKFLSLIALEWQLPQSAEGCNLEIHAYCGNKSIPAILGVLESSQNLETLVIHFHESSYEDDFPENEDPKNDLNCDLFHLKTVNFRSPNVDVGEPMLKLARIFLKRAIVLEKMVVDFPEFTSAR